MTLAEQYEKQEQYDLAYEEYKNQYNNNPNSVHTLQKLGHIATILDKKDEAEEYYKKVVELDVNNLVAYEQLMDICFENKDMFTYYLARGRMHVLQEQFEHAMNDFKKAIAQGGEDVKINSTRIMLAGLYENAEKYNKAIDEYLRVTDTDKATPEIYIKLASLYDKTGFTESAVEVLERAKEDGLENLDNELAKYYSKSNDPQKALDLTSDDLLKARSLMELGRNDEAIELLKSIEGSYKKDTTYLSLIAQYYFETGDYDMAFEKVENFAKFAPNSPLIYQMRALIYEKKGDEFNEHVNWAKFNTLRGNMDIAINEYITAHQINEKDVTIVATIADILDKSDKNRSIEFYEKLLDLDNNNKQALQKLAEFRESLGDYYDMLEYLKKLKKIDPRNPYVLENYERAEEMVTNPPSIFDNIMKFFTGK